MARSRLASYGLRMFAAVLVGVAPLAGCSGSGGAPTTLPSLSASPSATPSATAANDLDAATAVVRRYYALLNGPTTEANAAALAQLMTPDCSCREVVSAMLNAVQRNEHFFGQNHVVGVTASLDSPDAAEALVTYNYTDTGLKDAHGRVLSMSRGRLGTKQLFRLTRHSGSWKIATIIRVSAGQVR